MKQNNIVDTMYIVLLVLLFLPCIPYSETFAMIISKQETLSERKPELYGSVYTNSSGYRLRSGLTERASDDNGLHWMPNITSRIFKKGLPVGFKREEVASVLDKHNDRLITIVNALDLPGLDPNKKEPPEGQQHYYLRYRVSIDGAKSWLFDEQIIQAGNFHAGNPIEGVYKGKNAIYLGDSGCVPIINKKGQILVPAATNPIDTHGKLWNPSGGWTYSDVIILIGNWSKDNRILWQVSSRIKGDPRRSTRGMLEPTLAEFEDGKILVVMRGSNGGKADSKFELPSYKWFAISRDGGNSWTKPEPWAFDDGKPFYSPSSMSYLLKHSSGRVFWVGNISENNCRGNQPRWPLVMGEVYSKNMKLIRKSVIELDNYKLTDKEQGRHDLSLSHVSLIEDRETKEIIVIYPRYYNGYKSLEWSTMRIAID